VTPWCVSRRRGRGDAVRAWRAVLALGGGLLAACAAPAPTDDRAEPLFNELHAPDVLTEGRLLAPPPSMAGNRFVTGWSPWREGGELHLVARRRSARVQLVNLQPRPRILGLQAPRLLDGSDSARLNAYLGTWSVGEMGPGSWQVELPPIESLGRVTVDLGLAPGTALAVDGIGLRGSLPAGHVLFEGDDALQSGFSLIDLPLRVEGPAVLTGRFEPPRPARSGQGFRLFVERAGETVEAFRWRKGRLASLRGGRRLSVPLSAGPGFVRVRLLAEGEGAPARWRGLTVHRAPEVEPPSVAPPNPPRIVLVYVMDALRADSVGHLGGHPRATPVLDRLASEGGDFARHRSVAPNTLPATKTLFTGLVTFDDDALRRRGDGPVTLAQLFHDAGYATGMFTGNGYVYHLASRGFEHREQRVLYTQYESIGFNDNAGRAQAAALDWLGGLPAEQPVFLYVHPVNPHNPYEPPRDLEREWTAGADSRISASTETLLAVSRGEIQVDREDRERLEGLYIGGLAYNDRVLEGFLDELTRRCPDGELLVVLTSDHGEELFDHGGLLHGYTLHRELLEVPLTFWWPGRLPASVSTMTTDHLDLHHTLRQLVEPDAPAPPGALSLWPLLLGEPPPPRERVHFAAASSVDGGVFSASTDRWKLIWAPRQGASWGQGEGIGRTRDASYLFDLEADPEERENRAGEETIETTWLRSRLLAWIVARTAPAAPADDGPVSEELRRNLEALGYVD